MTGYTLAFKLAGVFFLCRFKFSAGCLYTLFSTGRIGLFGSIGKRVSNGPIEGKNSYIKKILFNANGFVNFERARNKIMYSQNHSQRFSPNKKQRVIKRKGKPRGKYKKSN